MFIFKINDLFMNFRINDATVSRSAIREQNMKAMQES